MGWSSSSCPACFPMRLPLSHMRLPPFHCIPADPQAARFPDTHYPYTKPLLASLTPPSSPIYLSAPTVTNNTLSFPCSSLATHISPAPLASSAVWSPPALLAHQIAYFRGLAESLASSGAGGAKEVIKDVIVTVPAWWTQHQRRAYRDALELQGLTCLSMIGEGTAVGMNFAMTRSFPNYDPSTGEGEKEYHVVYDSGALSTTATVLAFYQTSERPTPKSKTLINTTHVEVVSTGWKEVGGVDLDVAVMKLLQADFEKKSKKEVKGDKKALVKLQREAVRVKQILSANQDSNVAVSRQFLVQDPETNRYDGCLGMWKSCHTGDDRMGRCGV